MAALEERVLLLDRRLAALRKGRPDLQEALMRASLSAPRSAEGHPFPLPHDQVNARMRAGIPLLHDQPAYVDVHFAADVFSRLVNVLQQRDDAELGARLEGVVAAATSGSIDPQRLFGEAFVQHADHLAEIALHSGVDAELLSALATQAVAPLLRAYAERLLPLVQRLDDGSPEGAVWQQGYCPICGGWPLLAELRGIELAEYLRCGSYGSGWRSCRGAPPSFGDNLIWDCIARLPRQEDPLAGLARLPHRQHGRLVRRLTHGLLRGQRTATSSLGSTAGTRLVDAARPVVERPAPAISRRVVGCARICWTRSLCMPRCSAIASWVQGGLTDDC